MPESVYTPTYTWGEQSRYNPFEQTKESVYILAGTDGTYEVFLTFEMLENYCKENNIDAKSI